MIINDYGWDSYFEKEWENYDNNRYKPGRVIADYGMTMRIVIDSGEIIAKKDIRLETMEHPAVGDWVTVERDSDIEIPTVKDILKRKTKFSRAAAGKEVKEQIIATNIDTVFLLQSLNDDFNLRRLERYLIAAWESGAIPVIVLTKLDCCDDLASKLSQVYDIAMGVEVFAISSVTGEGICNLQQFFSYGKTVALLGSSGVGKSTLVNTLAGKEILRTQDIRDDDSKGRHTTTHREIVLFPTGGMIIDTPGMRELSLWEANTGISEVFGDIEELICKCRFNDCSHGNEPGCAIRLALESGELSQKRWNNWLKLQRELEFLEAKKEGLLRQKQRNWAKDIRKIQKETKKIKKM